jgi:hypothetical protein
MDEDMQQSSGKQETPETFCSENLNLADVLGDNERVCFLTPYSWTSGLLTFYYVRTILQILSMKSWAGLNRKRAWFSGERKLGNEPELHHSPIPNMVLSWSTHGDGRSFSVFNFPVPHKLAPD